MNFAISDDAHQGDGGFHTFATPANAITLNAWNHVAAVYDQTTGTRLIYINGVQVASRTDAPITITNSTADLGIGAWQTSSTDATAFFPGSIDEVDLFNRALSQTEIQAIYNAGSAGKCNASATPTDFDAVRDFNGTKNDANQVWQYGYDGTGLAVKITNTASTTPAPTPTPTPTPSPTATPSPSPSPSPAAGSDFTLSFDGKLRDRVSNTKNINGSLLETAAGYDGRLDGVFTITLSPANKGRAITGLKLEGPNGYLRNTEASNRSVAVVAIADTLDGQLLMNGDGSVSTTLGATNKLFAADNSNAETSPANTAFATGANFTLTITFQGGQTASATTTVGQLPTTDLGLRVSAQDAGGVTLKGSIASGQRFRYYADVANYSEVTATNPILVVDLPQGIAFDSSDQASSCKVDSTGRTVTCTRGNSPALGAASSGNNHLVGIFYVHATQAGSFETTAAAFSDQPEAVDDQHPNKFSLTTTTNTATDIAITVDGDSNPVQADSPLIYTARVLNKGPLAAPNTQVVFILDSDTVYVQYQDQSRNCIAVSSRQVICTISNLPLGETIEKFQVRPKGTVKQVTVKATVTSGIYDYDSTNNTASVTTTVVPNAPPINDNFPSALNKLGNYLLPGMTGTVSGSTQLQGTVKGTNVGASTQSPILYDRTGEIYHADKKAAKSVWYVWQPPTDAAGTVEFSTGGTSFDASRSTFDTTLEVRATSLDTFGSFPVVKANDNVTAGDSTSKVKFDYRPDQIYIIAVDGANGATGFIALHWSVALKQTPALPQQVLTQVFPEIGCTKESDQSQKLCQASLDPSTGYHIIHVRGTNFTSSSQVIVNKTPLSGFDKDGKPINGFTSVIYNTNGSIKELEAHLPPSPSFDNVKINDINVITPVPAGTTAKGATSIKDLAGSCLLAANTGQVKTIVLKNATIPVGKTQTVCGHLDFLGNADDETCIDFVNDGTSGVPVTVNPVYFEIYAYCATQFPGTDRASFDQRQKCSATNGFGAERLAQALGKGFAINPQTAIANGIFKIAPHGRAAQFTRAFDARRRNGFRARGVCSCRGRRSYRRGRLKRSVFNLLLRRYGFRCVGDLHIRCFRITCGFALLFRLHRRQDLRITRTVAVITDGLRWFAPLSTRLNINCGSALLPHIQTASAHSSCSNETHLRTFTLKGCPLSITEGGQPFVCL